MLRRIEVSTANVTISFQAAASRSAVKVSEVMVITFAAISALTRVDMSGGRATKRSVSATFLELRAASSFSFQTVRR